MTGNFYRNPTFNTLIRSLRKDGHYLGAHSDKHLLYCDWVKRDSLLVDKQTLLADLENNYREMKRFGIKKEEARFFMPPYEWYNDSVSAWISSAGLQIVNFTPGTGTNADYTTPSMPNYRNSESIHQSLREFEKNQPSGLNGFILLMHIGTHPERSDKFYLRLPEILRDLQGKGYTLCTVDQLLKTD